MPPKKLSCKARTPDVLFVDDLGVVRQSQLGIAKNLGINAKFAPFPDVAQGIIGNRVRQAARLRGKFMARLQRVSPARQKARVGKTLKALTSAKRKSDFVSRIHGLIIKTKATIARSKSQKEFLKLQLRTLKTLRRLVAIEEKPFDAAVVDINMPDRNPVGIDFIRDLRLAFPKIKIIVYSDDKDNVEMLRKMGFGIVPEKPIVQQAHPSMPEYFPDDEPNLKRALIRVLRLKK